jgi:hypothetical protein
MAVGGPLYGNTDSEYTYAHGGPVVSNVNQDFDLYAQNRGGMMMSKGGNMYAVGGGPGDELDPEQLKAQGYVEYDNYFYNPTTGQYVDKPSISFPGEAENQKNRIERFMQPDFQINEKDIKPLLGLLANTGIYEMPINTGKTTSFGGVKKPGMENVIGPDSFVDGTRRIEPYLSFNEGVDTYPGKYNLQYVDPYTLEGNEMMNERYPILDREGNIQTTPEDFARLQSFGSSGRDEYNLKKFNKNYNQVMSTRDKVRRAYQNKSPYLNDVVDKPAKPNTYLNNLNTPNVVDNQGNTSSIFGRQRNNNISQPTLFTLQPNNVDPNSPGPDYIKSGGNWYNPKTGDVIFNEPDPYELQPYQYNNNVDPSKTVDFIPPDVIANRNKTSTIEDNYGPIIPDDTIPRENAKSLEGLTSPQTYPELLPPQGPYNPYGEYGFYGKDVDGNDVSINPNMVNQYEQGWKPEGTSSLKSKSANQPNQGLTGLDYASGLLQASGPLSQIYYGAKGPDPVNYERIKADKIDPTVAIILAAEEGRRAQDSAAYLMRQNAPTSGSYMNNLRNLSLQSGKQRGLQSASLRQAADIENTRMQNQVNAQNAQISMQEQIDRLQEKDAARTNVTEGLSGLGSSTANMIRDYRTNQINNIIAKNIGTNDWRFDTVTNEIVFKRDGKEFRLPAQTVVGTNPANIGTGQIQQLPSLQIQRDFDNSLNESFGNRFTGPNAGK